MSRLRLSALRRLEGTPAAPVPTRLGAVAILLTRRQFLAALGAAGVLAAAPWRRVERAWAVRRGRFFTTAERRTLGAFADTMLPPDGDPGAAQLGVVQYVERLLTAFERRVPEIYAGGPYSGRNPFIDYERGVPSRRRPGNDFRHFVAPSRLQSLYWRWQVVGTAGLPVADRALIDPLDAQLGGPLVGLRDRYRNGLAQLDALSRAQEGGPLHRLDPAARDRVLDTARRTFPVDPRRGRSFVGLVLQHAIEAAFAAPEYGGNRRARGWAMLGLEGDSQPLGYALYASADDAYHERADHPLSTANPDEVAAPKPIGAEADLIQRTIVATTNALPGGCG